MMSSAEDAFIFDIPDNELIPEGLAGEALVLTARKPVDGIGVIVDIGGSLSAWTYRNEGGHVWIENRKGDRVTSKFRVRGVIARVAREKTFLD